MLDNMNFVKSITVKFFRSNLGKYATFELLTTVRKLFKLSIIPNYNHSSLKQH
jgi:hypothetical protein